MTARPQEAALRVAALQALRDLIDVGVTQAREELLSAMIDLQEREGAEMVKVRLGADGTHVATTALIWPRPGIDVDPSKLLAYVKANHPTEVVEAVTEPFRRALIARLKIEDDGTVIDPGTGIIADFATARPATGKPSFRLTYTAGDTPGRAAIAKAWRTGQLAFIDPVQPLGGAE